MSKGVIQLELNQIFTEEEIRNAFKDFKINRISSNKAIAYVEFQNENDVEGIQFVFDGSIPALNDAVFKRVPPNFVWEEINHQTKTQMQDYIPKAYEGIVQIQDTVRFEISEDRSVGARNKEQQEKENLIVEINSPLNSQETIQLHPHQKPIAKQISIENKNIFFIKTEEAKQVILQEEINQSKQLKKQIIIQHQKNKQHISQKQQKNRLISSKQTKQNEKNTFILEQNLIVQIQNVQIKKQNQIKIQPLKVDQTIKPVISQIKKQNEQEIKQKPQIKKIQLNKITVQKQTMKIENKQKIQQKNVQKQPKNKNEEKKETYKQDKTIKYQKYLKITALLALWIVLINIF